MNYEVIKPAKEMREIALKKQNEFLLSEMNDVQDAISKAASNGRCSMLIGMLYPDEITKELESKGYTVTERADYGYMVEW